MKELNWNSNESHIFLNPKASSFVKKQVDENDSLWNKFPSTIWLQSSGSSAPSSYYSKWIGISKEAILHSADHVNQWIESTAQDIWLQSLPEFHIGGLSIIARSHLSGAKRVSGIPQWNVGSFLSHIRDNGVTLASLVPTQLYDLVLARESCPPSLRCVFVGGGPLSDDLYQSARKLGWPILITYGMTEMGSQVATSTLQEIGSETFPYPTRLPHVQWQISNDRTLTVSGRSLASQVVILEKEKVDIQSIGEAYKSDDLVELDPSGERIVKVTRKGRVTKINGELVDLLSLEQRINMGQSRRVILLPRPSIRRGSEVVAVVEGIGDKDLNKRVKQFNTSIAPYERIHGIYSVDTIPQSPLGKVRYQELAGFLFYSDSH